ncbi:MAG: agmatine deiminase family protein [Gemmatimonadales bacterium]|nr:agmatine deiminase family protein [Gemmatimonadales bacterium]MDQ3426305.1 agmatine deiminase family protein [Gemmatimonadota bacterium]
MPAEWEPHRGTWLSWPHKEASWPGRFGSIPATFARMVRYLGDHEEVHINVAGPAMEEDVRRLLADEGAGSGNVFFHYHPTNDAWCRDHGPIFLQRSAGGRREQAIVDWKYNAWGNKYPPYDLDDVIPSRIGEELDIPVYSPGMVLEGGSIDVNGRGTLLTTEACLLNPNRNPELGREEIESYLRDYLGVSRILWLGDGIAGDDTDGHVDDLTRFVAADTVVTVVEDDPADENYEPLQDNLQRLRGMTDQDGRPLRVITLPMPRPVWHQGQRLPASYANFYIANGVVLLPTYDPERDAEAQTTLQNLFPDREVVGIDCTHLVWGLGAFHCVTQQWPRV